jgi:SanA protein
MPTCFKFLTLPERKTDAGHPESALLVNLCPNLAPMRKWLLRLTLLSLLAGISGLWLIQRAIAKSSVYIYDAPENLAAAYTGIVPGAKVYSDGRLSHMLEDRVVSAAQLYKERKIRKILLTGDHGRVKYDEVNAMRRKLRQLGIPERDIFLDHAGFTTYDSLYRARDILGVKDCIVVTQRFHLPRAVYTARSLGLDCTGYVADRRRYTAASHNWSKFREFFSKLKAWFQVKIWKPKPRFLGEKISIYGNPQLTKDK